MSARICHVRQARKASSLEAVRLVVESLRGSKVESWAAPAGSEFAAQDIESAADWIQGQLVNASDRSPGLELLCLDVEGSLCSWVSSPSREGQVLAAVARNFGADPESSSASISPVAVYAQSQLESSVQAIGVAPQEQEDSKAGKSSKSRGGVPSSHRTPVLVSSEAPARLLLDALDRRKIAVAQVASLWQVMAAAWDPAAQAEGGNSKPESVRETAIATASIVVDLAGRVLWAWSIKGVLLAAGAIRTQAADRGDILTSDVAARLATEWLAWSAQVGVSPQRVICIAAEGDNSAGSFGAALTQAWPGAAVDLQFDEDPILATLRRAARVLEDQAGVIAPLQGLDTRPGRLHRSMYSWIAIAIVIIAAAISALAFKFSRDAAIYRTQAAAIKEQWQGIVKEAMPAALTSPYGEIDALQQEVTKREHSLKPPEKAEPTYPVMEALEVISMVLSTSNVQLDDVTLDTQISKVTIRVTLPTTRTEDGEALYAALRAIENPYISSWDPPDFKSVSGRTQATLIGTWSDMVKAGRSIPAGDTK